VIRAGAASRRSLIAAAGSAIVVLAVPSRAEVAIRRVFVDAPSGQVHARVASPGAERDAKPPVACFHFTPGSSRMFEAVMPLLAADRRVVAFDSPGYGDSEPPSLPLDLGGLADSLTAAMSKVEMDPARVRLDLIGSATGALIAIELASRFPTTVRRMVISGVPAFTAAERSGMALEIDRIEAEQRADSGGAYIRRRLDEVLAQRGDEPLAPHINAFIDSLSPGARWADAERAAAAYPAEDVLPQLGQPVLLFLNPNARSMATKRTPELIKNVRVVAQPRAGSMAWQVAPEEMMAHIRPFLDGAQP